MGASARIWRCVWMSKKQKKKIYRILFLLSLIIFLICAGMLLWFWWDYRKAEVEYDQVAENVVSVRPQAQEPEGGASGEEAQGGAQAPAEDKDRPALIIDFGELAQINDDVVAWIDFPGQDISYPVVQGDDNSRYLRWSVNGTRSSSGAIFADYRNEGVMKDGNTIIYGHNMRNGSMFGTLRRYREKEYCEQFPYFDVYTPEGVYRCVIIVSSQVRPYEDSYRVVFSDADDRDAYISLVKERQYYELPQVESDGSVPAADFMKVLGRSGSGEGSAPPLVLLSTCTGSGHAYRNVLLAQVQKFYPAEDE